MKMYEKTCEHQGGNKKVFPVDLCVETIGIQGCPHLVLREHVNIR